MYELSHNHLKRAPFWSPRFLCFNLVFSALVLSWLYGVGGWLKCSSEICVMWGLESLLSCRYGFLVNNGKIRLFFWHCGLPYEYLLSTVHLKFFVLALCGYKNLIQELPDRSSHGWFGDAGMLWALLQVLRSPVLPGKQAAPDNKFI